MNNAALQAASPSRLTQAEKWMPGLRVLSTYQLAWLPRDAVAGVVLCTLLVPQGMAYAELAGLPAITGLYTTVVCLVAYAIFGPSPFLVLGPAPFCPWRRGIWSRPLPWLACWPSSSG
jgi:hypothetical protein